MFFRSIASTAAVLAAIIMAVNSLADEPTQTPPENAASVNGSMISRKSLDREFEMFKGRMSQQGRTIPEMQIPMVQKQILSSMVDQELLYQESQKKGVKVDPSEIEAQLASLKKRFTGDAEFQQALKEMDLTEEEIKFLIQKGLSIQKLIDTEITAKIAVSEKESKEYYDTHPDEFKQEEAVKASHILIKVESDASEADRVEARKKIEDVRKKLQDGEDFAEAARKYSEGPSSAQGGDLGYFTRGRMVKSFEDAAFTLEKDQVSEIVESPFGYHLIKVYDRRPENTLAYNEVKAELDQQLKQQKMRLEVDQYLDTLKKDADIKLFL